MMISGGSHKTSARACKGVVFAAQAKSFGVYASVHLRVEEKARAVGRDGEGAAELRARGDA